MPNRAGVVQVVTGGGKTVFALACIQQVLSDDPNRAILILVPTTALLDQWYIELQTSLNIAPREIGLLQRTQNSSPPRQFTIGIFNSARRLAKAFSDAHCPFLIVDECHRAGSPANAAGLRGSHYATLGLSATPKREYDEGFNTHVLPFLGPIIYKYSYREAAEDGVIAPFSLKNIEVHLLPDEEAEYNRLSRRIVIARRKDADDTTIKRLLQQRAAVSAKASMRVPIAAKLVDMHQRRRCIVFHERTDEADKIVEILQARGHRVTIYHSGIGENVRRDNLRLYRKGVFDVLVCCRALDEGMNVPETEIAIIASSTASSRQRIQRLGRVLRPAPGKSSATIFTLFATKEERDRLANEESSLEGLASVQWQTSRVKSNG